VPFCRRTASREKFPNCDEIICGKHWRNCAGGASWPAQHDRAPLPPPIRRPRLLGIPARPRRSRIEGARLNRLLNDLWERCKKAAIEAAAGLR
jgi:hypothetical protein